MQILADDRVEGRLDDGGKMARAFFRLTPLRHVQRKSDDAHDAPGFVQLRHLVGLQPAHAAFRHERLDPVPLWQAGRKDLVFLPRVARGLRRAEFRIGAAFDLLARQPHQPRQLRVHFHEPVLAVFEKDEGRHAIEDHSQFRVLPLEVGGLFRHASFQFRVELADAFLRVLACDDFLFQRRIRLAQLRRAGQGDRRGEEPDQQQRRGDRSQRRDGFHPARKPVGGVPHIPDFQQVRRPARDDEKREAADDEAEGQIVAFSQEIDEPQRDGKIGEHDQRIANHMQP